MVEFQKYITNGQNGLMIKNKKKSLILKGIYESIAWGILKSTDCVSITKWSVRLQISK